MNYSTLRNRFLKPTVIEDLEFFAVNFLLIDDCKVKIAKKHKAVLLPQ